MDGYGHELFSESRRHSFQLPQGLVAHLVYATGSRAVVVYDKPRGSAGS